MTTNQYHVLYDISKALHTQHLDWSRTLQTVVSRAGEAIGVQHGCLVTFHDNQTVDKVFILGAADTPRNRDREMWNTLMQRGLVGYIFHSDRLMNIRNIQTDPLWPDLPDVSIIPSQGSAVGLPLGTGKAKYAVLVYFHPSVDYFTQEHHALLTEIADLAAAALQNARELQNARHQDIRYQSVFEHTMVPIVLTDEEGRIQDANFKACEFLGFKRSVLVNVLIQDINVLSAGELDIEHLPLNKETYFRTSVYDIDGRELPTLVRLRRIEVDGRSMLEWMLQDISIQMELEQLRLDLTAMIFHDLRGPLTNMQVSIHKLAEVLQKHQNPAVLKLLTLGLRSTQQLHRLVDSLLDIQRLEAGSSMLNRQPTEMHPVLKNSIQLVQPLANEAHQKITFNIDPIPVVMLDTDMITRVAINLLENAIKYTPDGGKIHLTANIEDNTITVAIIDSGPGIPEEMRAQIFDKFSRIKYQDAPKGVGLGLSFCKLAVEAHGGRIWVESDGKNGSTFKFALPVIPYNENGKKSSSNKKVAASA